MNKTLIVQPSGGLCNRMRTIVGAASLASITGHKLVVVWTSDITLNARFKDLFEPLPFKTIDVKLPSIRLSLIWNWYHRFLGYMNLSEEWVLENTRNKPLESWLPKLADRNVYMYSGQDVIRTGDYSIFKINHGLSTTEIGNNVIGIHIRRTDNEMSKQFSPTSLFIDEIAKEIELDPDIKFYLATDDPKEEEIFKEKFGDKIIVYKKTSLDRNDPLAIRDAVIDLYNLSRCKKIYGSYYSSFSDVAAYWGGIEKKVLKLDE